MIPMQNNLAQRVAGVGQLPVMGTQGTAMPPQNNIARPVFGAPGMGIQGAQPIQVQPMPMQQPTQVQQPPPMQNNLRARLGMMA